MGPEGKMKRVEVRALGRLVEFRFPGDDPAHEHGVVKGEDLLGAVISRNFSFFFRMVQIWP